MRLRKAVAWLGGMTVALFACSTFQGTDEPTNDDTGADTTKIDASADSTAGDALPPTDAEAEAVAAYTFDEGAGATVRDTSGHGNDGRLENDPTWTEGKVRGALGFAPSPDGGASPYVHVPSSPSLDVSGNAITVAFWARLTHTPNDDQVLFGKMYEDGAFKGPFYQYGIEYNHAKTMDFFFATSAKPEDERALSIPLDTVVDTELPWTHFAFTYDGAIIIGYRNGSVAAATQASGSLLARGTGLLIGVDGSHGQPFLGALDELRIYDRVLGAAEVQKLASGS